MWMVQVHSGLNHLTCYSWCESNSRLLVFSPVKTQVRRHDSWGFGGGGPPRDRRNYASSFSFHEQFKGSPESHDHTDKNTSSWSPVNVISCIWSIPTTFGYTFTVSSPGALRFAWSTWIVQTEAGAHFQLEWKKKLRLLSVVKTRRDERKTAWNWRKKVKRRKETWGELSQRMSC